MIGCLLIRVRVVLVLLCCCWTRSGGQRAVGITAYLAAFHRFLALRGLSLPLLYLWLWSRAPLFHAENRGQAGGPGREECPARPAKPENLDALIRTGALAGEHCIVSVAFRIMGTPVGLCAAYRELRGMAAGGNRLVCFAVQANSHLAVVDWAGGFLGRAFNVLFGRMERGVAAGRWPRRMSFPAWAHKR